MPSFDDVDMRRRPAFIPYTIYHPYGIQSSDKPPGQEKELA
jgi:hypothetical protein